ncbi:MAG: hypothetical protein KC547_11890 [Anaerolineae bacterium]|nr:hypothetical protein [Anaerolineae bacterium]
MFLGFSLGAAMGVIFQSIFLSVSWQTIIWGFGFGGIGGLIVGVIDGLVALWLLPRFFAHIPDVAKYRQTLNGVLLLATIFATFIVYAVMFFIVVRNLAMGLLCASPVVFLSAICSLIASHILGSWYLRYLESQMGQ